MKNYLHYLHNRRSKYYIHSPFVFSFINDVLNDDREFYCYEEIESLRKNLLRSKDKIDVQDFGAGSVMGPASIRKISSIAKTSAAPAKYSKLLFRIVNHFRSNKILELGTSLGISTAYLSAWSNEAEVVTLEGSLSVTEQAKKNFSYLGRNNINLINGRFEDKLSSTVQQMKKIDFLFLDGNHRLSPTLSYFETCLPYLHQDSIVVLDDIHWSEEMLEAWNEIISRPEVTLSFDLFRLGILFFRKDRVKENFTLWF